MQPFVPYHYATFMPEYLTEKEELEINILIVQEWTINRTCSEIGNLFFCLREFDQSQNLELWKALRSAMGANKELLDEQLQYYIYEPVLATNGWWWSDKKNWSIE